MDTVIYGLYASRGNGENLWGVDTDAENLRVRYNTYQRNSCDPEPEIVDGVFIIHFLGSTSGGLDYPPSCYFEIREVNQFDKWMK